MQNPQKAKTTHTTGHPQSIQRFITNKPRIKCINNQMEVINETLLLLHHSRKCSIRQVSFDPHCLALNMSCNKAQVKPMRQNMIWNILCAS